MKGSNSIGEADLHAFVDGESPPERRQEIEAFLSREPRQASRVEMWRRQNDIIRATFARVASEPLPLSLSVTNHTGARLEAVTRLPQPTQPNEPIRLPGRNAFDPEAGRHTATKRFFFVGIGAFLAGGIIGLCAATLVGEQTGRLVPVHIAGSTQILAPVILRQGPTSPEEDFAGTQLASRAIAAHRTYAPDLAHPVDVAASEGVALNDWLSHRVAVPINPPDLSSEGLHLLGGRLTPGDRTPAAFLIYADDAGDRIGLYIARTAPEMALALRFQQGGSVSAAAWISNGAGYALTGAEDRDQLLSIARRAQHELAASAPPP